MVKKQKAPLQNTLVSADFSLRYKAGNFHGEKSPGYSSYGDQQLNTKPLGLILEIHGYFRLKADFIPHSILDWVALGGLWACGFCPLGWEVSQQTQPCQGQLLQAPRLPRGVFAGNPFLPSHRPSISCCLALCHISQASFSTGMLEETGSLSFYGEVRVQVS